MKIIFITTLTPTPTNVKGPSSLPFHLIQNRPYDIDIDILTFNENHLSNHDIAESEKELKCKINTIESGFSYKLLCCNGIRTLINRFSKLPLKAFQTTKVNIKPIIDGYDAVWIYPHILFKLVKNINKKIIVTGPDSAALYYKRCLQDKYVQDKRLQYIYIDVYNKFLYLEKCWSKKTNVILHFVGKADEKYYKQKTGGKSFFLLHPYNFKIENNNKYYRFKNKKISVVISGAFDIYTYTDAKIIFDLLCHDSSFIQTYAFTFIGKGWELFSMRMSEVGYDVSHLYWVDDYFGEINKHDMQLFPISVGVGTKGKVLDALCCGLLCVGSKYAFENINLIDRNSCLQYSNPNNIATILKYINNHRQMMNMVAMNGYNIVTNEHNPRAISADFFNCFTS